MRKHTSIMELCQGTGSIGKEKDGKEANAASGVFMCGVQQLANNVASLSAGPDPDLAIGFLSSYNPDITLDF